MPILPRPLSMRLDGGLRDAALAGAGAMLGRVLGVPLRLAHDLELGGAHYDYRPDPVPATGLASALVHVNDIPGFGLVYRHRPDLRLALSVAWFGADLLDLGRLEYRLRSACGGAFDVAGYAVVTLPPARGRAPPAAVHWAEFAAAPGGPALPSATAPRLACTLGFELAPGDEAPLRALLASLEPVPATLRKAAAGPADSGRLRIAATFAAASLLDPGRHAQAVEEAFGLAVRVVSLRVAGDLLADGRARRIEQTFGVRRAPAWHGPVPGD